MTVRCPNCASANSAEAKFCSTCGSRLHLPTEGRCPACNAANPPSNIFCDECGARLVPARPTSGERAGESPVRGLSLPRREPTAEEDAPDWLARLRSSYSDQETGPPATPETPPAAASEPSAPPDMAELQLGKLDTGELPDWLREIAEPGLQPTSGPEPEEPEPSGMPDWLQEAMEEPQAPPETAHVAPFVPGALEAPPEVEAPELAPGEVPSWLAELAPPEVRGRPAATPPPQSSAVPDLAPADIPDWLQEFAPPEAKLEPKAELPAARPEAEGLAPAEIPDWLKELAPTSAAPEAEVASPAGPADVEELMPAEIPDWLQEYAPAKTGPEREPESPPAEPATRGPAPAEIPDWLQALAPTEVGLEPEAEPLPTEPVPEVAASAEVPDWLKEFALPEAEPPPTEPEIEGLTPADVPDWLRAFSPEAEIEPEEPPAPETVPLQPEAVDLQLAQAPEWLETMEVTETDLEALAAEPEPDETQPAPIPDWLQELVPEQEEPAAEFTEFELPADTEELKPGELPDWLRDFAVPEGEADMPSLAPPAPLIPEERPAPPPQRPARRPSTGPLDAEALTDWLGRTAPLPDSHALPTRSLVGTGPLVPPELPDWLASVSDTESPALPDWLVSDSEELLATGAAPAWAGPAPAGEERERGLPSVSWPSSEQAALAPAEDTAAPAAEPGPRPSVSLPDWLRPAEVETPEVEIEPGELPDWLMRPSLAAGAGVAAPRTAEGLVQAVIPEWLQALKPRELMEGPLDEEALRALEPAEKGGPLDGLRGALMAEEVVSKPPVSGRLPRFVITEQQKAHAQVLEQIVLTGPAPKPEFRPPHRAWGWLEQVLIPLLVLLAVLVAVVLGNPIPWEADAQPVPQDIVDTCNLIEILPQSAPVVVAFDYSPATAGELEAVSAAMLRHLMTHRARILMVSTTPTGAELAQRLMDDLAATYNYVYGADYMNLGYIPGGATGLQTFAASPWSLFSGPDYLGSVALAREAPLGAGTLVSLADAKLVLILTAERSDLVGWIEQVGRLPEMKLVPLVAGVSAGLEVWARPYLQANVPQLKGLVAGVPGAAQYERRLEQQYGPELAVEAGALRDSQTTAVVVIAAFIVIGLLWGGIAGLLPASARSAGRPTTRRQADG